jgi:hypothetical protein
LENRYFLKDALSPEQHNNYLSIVAEPEYYRAWDDGRQSFTFVPFARIDQYDDERTHVDIRELEWIKAAEDHEWRIGVRTVFWGVTEFRHLVDIINQTDAVENIDGEDKLGQPMVNFALIKEWGTLDLFVLVGFRERTFPGVEGRPRTIPPVDPDQSDFESSDEEDHIDFAIRWSHTLGDWDIGVYQFSGTSRTTRSTKLVSMSRPLKVTGCGSWRRFAVPVRATASRRQPVVSNTPLLALPNQTLIWA